MKTLLKTLTTLAVLVLSLQAQAQPNQVIIDHMIDAYGGEKNLVQMNHYDQIWTIETRTTDTNGTDKRSVHLPYYLKTELIYPNKTEIRLLDHDTGTKQFGSQIIPAHGPMLDAMKTQLMRLYHPLILKEQIANITVAETPEHYILTLNAGTVSADYFVSRKSYLIDKVIGRLQMGPQQMEFLTLYDDYKPFKGVMIPHAETKYAGSVNTAVMRLEKTTLTAPVQ